MSHALLSPLVFVAAKSHDLESDWRLAEEPMVVKYQDRNNSRFNGLFEIDNIP
ncbi:hypothetical protein [Desulfobacter sp. UBA2225]|uniref:hypothetical protein n=1 Tax=Desulfobacter sp. UBA2225 TaxID=1961413 RepID=UPI002580BD27|nr:hypothetical protein [Desulfobacter sp. UBA2225]